MAYFLITLYPNYLLNADYHTGKTVVFPLTNQFNFLTCKLPKDFCFWQTFKYPFQCLSHLRKFLSFTHTEDFFKLLNLKEHFCVTLEQSKVLSHVSFVLTQEFCPGFCFPLSTGFCFIYNKFYPLFSLILLYWKPYPGYSSFGILLEFHLCAVWQEAGIIY